MRCRICQRQIVILIRRGTGICCNQCEKIDNAELSVDEAIKFLTEVNPNVLNHPYVRSFIDATEEARSAEANH